MTEMTIDNMMASMPRAVRLDAIQGVDAVIQFSLTGPEGGDYIVTIQNGQVTVTPGVAEKASVTLRADAQDYKDVITGASNAMQAFMTGKLKLEGDLSLAMKLPAMFKMGG